MVRPSDVESNYFLRKKRGLRKNHASASRKSSGNSTRPKPTKRVVKKPARFRSPSREEMDEGGKIDVVPDEQKDEVEDAAGEDTSLDDRHAVNFDFEYRRGDLFTNVPPGAVLVHACNCEGKWGAGIATQFRARYPRAFEKYKQHCQAFAGNPEGLLGTSLIIQTSTPAASRNQANSSDNPGQSSKDAHNMKSTGVQSPPEPQQGSTHYVCCLFTRATIIKPGGKENVDGADKTIRYSKLALEHMVSTLRNTPATIAFSEVRMPKIGAGKFQVPWERMMAELKSTGFSLPPHDDGPFKIIVYEL